MSALRQAEERVLRERARYFFTTPMRGRPEVGAFAAELRRRGDCAVVGGMLRDVLLGGNRAFRSDVDFVADVDDLEEFDRWMAGFGARTNRFGGYALSLSRWNVDVWPLRRTWAARNAGVRVDSIDDILGTTFFDWDAIVYRPHTARVTARADYFDRIRTRVLDVNLLPNPNPLGNAVRALRYACLWDARLAPKLAEHVERELTDAGWERAVGVEAASFGSLYLRYLDPAAVMERLRRRADGPVAIRCPRVAHAPDAVRTSVRGPVL